MGAAMAGTELEVDARGLLCPLPVLRLARALRAAPAGALARLLATDPAAAQDVATFCRERSCRLLETGESGGVYSFLVVKDA
ncbi:MAG TPA: sulfurtransferase TusA family protein [Thermoanaerobaculia bacterium]|nr:sulfurtransferase TusA family protein [Thermoanaerobaculia bacterium]